MKKVYASHIDKKSLDITLLWSPSKHFGAYLLKNDSVVTSIDAPGDHNFPSTAFDVDGVHVTFCDKHTVGSMQR